MLKIVSAAKNDRPIINSTCPYFGYKKFRYLTIIYKNIALFCCKRKFFQIFIQNFVFSYCIMSHSFKKIWNVVSTVLVALVVLLAVALVGVRLVGLNTYVVLSGSMEPTYHTGSLLYVKSVDPQDLQVGDPITFMLNEDTVATHRIIEILPDQEDSSVLRFRTQGDANDAPDGTPVHYKNVIGKPVFSVPYLGYFANFVQNPPGLYFAIGFAVVLVLLVFLPDLLDDSDKKGKGKGKGDGAAPTAHD